MLDLNTLTREQLSDLVSLYRDTLLTIADMSGSDAADGLAAQAARQALEDDDA